MISLIIGAMERLPAGHPFCVSVGGSGDKKKHLSFDMVGDFSPALFVAVYRLYGCPYELGCFFLGFFQCCSYFLNSIVSMIALFSLILLGLNTSVL